MPADERASQSKEKDAAKLNSIIQHFYTKAALTIISSRVNLPQSFYRDTNQPRSNRWFNLVLDESDVLTDDLEKWANVDISKVQPSVLVVETYLDTAELTRTQSLVVVDERGRKWDVAEALATTNQVASDRNNHAKDTKIVLERWRICLGGLQDGGPPSTESMPNVYKKAVLLFRSLYACARFLPAWKFGRRLAKQPATLNSVRPMYRISQENDVSPTKDPIHVALYPSKEPTSETYRFKPTNTPAGPMCIEVSYRVNCDFRVDESEALLSSRFMGMDDQYFTPSLGDKTGANPPYRTVPKEVGSLPTDKRHLAVNTERNPAYGSMSTFHHTGAQSGTSPMSALRAARERNRGPDSPDSYPSKALPSPRGVYASKSSLRSGEAGQMSSRRVSVSFMPFKAGSLSSSPGPGYNAGPSSLRASNLTTGLAQAAGQDISSPPYIQSQKSSPVPEIAIGSPGSSSPKAPPMTRFSSSFSNRKSRFSSAGGSSGIKLEDDNSSGRTSLTSSNQPESRELAEGGGGGDGGSSTSLQTDDGNISNFLKLLEGGNSLGNSEKDFFETPRVATPPVQSSLGEAPSRTAINLSRYRQIRETMGGGDSPTSPFLLPQSPPNFPSRGLSPLSSVPPGLVGNSVSTSSTSPGKPISPHTPHTPAIPSRLSANAIIDEHSLESSPPRSRHHYQTHRRQQSSTASDAYDPHHSTAIDIPTSPNRYTHSHIRRTSSARARRQVLEEEFGLRSASMPGHGDAASSSSPADVFALQGVMSPGDARSRPEPARGGVAVVEATTSPSPRAAMSTSARPTMLHPASHMQSQRGGGAGPRGSSTSFGGNSISGSGSGSSERGSLAAGRVGGGGSVSASGTVGRYSSFSAARAANAAAAAATMDDDEPLLFTMSELGSQSQQAQGSTNDGAVGRIVERDRERRDRRR